MLAIHALLTPIPLRRITIPKLTPFILSQSESSSGSFSGLITFYRRRRSYRVITSMAAGSGSISTEHVTEKWFSVPELRLRNHRFSVPLDYSKNSPKITVFAREIVAGKQAFKDQSLLTFSLISNLKIDYNNSWERGAGVAVSIVSTGWSWIRRSKT